MPKKIKVTDYVIDGDNVVYNTETQCPVYKLCKSRIFLDFCQCVNLEEFCKYVYVKIPVCNGTEAPVIVQAPVICRGRKMIGYQLARYVNEYIARCCPAAELTCMYNGDLQEIHVLNNNIEHAIPLCCDAAN